MYTMQFSYQNEAAGLSSADGMLTAKDAKDAKGVGKGVGDGAVGADRHYYPTRSRSAPAISSNIPAQSSGCFCRNSRIVGYHGLSLRSKSHRQSGTKGNATQ